MTYIIVSIKDVLSGNFTELNLFQNEAVAKRWFKGLCAESKIAQDLQMFKLGTYNTELGEIVPCLEFMESGTNEA